jgi:hypothetical protein
MNDRINELTKQCTTYYNGGLGTEIEVFDKEKFVKLIVQECAQVADTERSNALGCGYITKTTGMRIKEHFGVEE